MFVIEHVLFSQGKLAKNNDIWFMVYLLALSSGHKWGASNYPGGWCSQEKKNEKRKKKTVST